MTSLAKVRLSATVAGICFSNQDIKSLRKRQSIELSSQPTGRRDQYYKTIFAATELP